MNTTHLLDALRAAIQIRYHTRELHSKARFKRQSRARAPVEAYFCNGSAHTSIQ